MLNDPEKQSENQPVEVRSYFVRERNALLVRSQFTSIYTDYYLHLMQHGVRYDPVPDNLLKIALAAVTLDLASRPWKEAVAWTLNFQAPLLNIFVTGSNRNGTVTGRAFTENVKQAERQTLHSQITTDGVPTRRSTIEFSGGELFPAVEKYYQQSEQRLARLFDLGDEDYVMITAQPDCDHEWLSALTVDAVKKIDQPKTLSLLEKREYRFECGCSEDRFYPSLMPLSENEIDEIFSGQGITVANCPRCGADIQLSRQGFDAFVVREKENEN